MKLFNILVLAYLLLVVVDDFAVWAFNKWVNKLIGKLNTEELPKRTYNKVLKVIKVKRGIRTSIRIVQVVLVGLLASAVIVSVGMVIIKF